MKLFYTLTELTQMKTLDTDTVFGELKVEDADHRIWFDPSDNIVVIMTPDYNEDGTWIVRDEYTAIDLPQAIVARVLYKIHDGEVVFTKPAYVFETPTSIYIEEAEYSTDSFRLEYDEDSDSYSILALSDEEFFVSDDVTDLFDVNQILAQCEAAEDIEDRTLEYLIFYIKDLERELES